MGHTGRPAVLRCRRCGRAAGSRWAGLGERARADGQHCAREHAGSAEPLGLRLAQAPAATAQITPLADGAPG